MKEWTSWGFELQQEKLCAIPNKITFFSIFITCHNIFALKRQITYFDWWSFLVLPHNMLLFSYFTYSMRKRDASFLLASSLEIVLALVMTRAEKVHIYSLIDKWNLKISAFAVVVQVIGKLAEKAIMNLLSNFGRYNNHKNHLPYCSTRVSMLTRVKTDDVGTWTCMHFSA